MGGEVSIVLLKVRVKQHCHQHLNFTCTPIYLYFTNIYSHICIYTSVSTGWWSSENESIPGSRFPKSRFGIRDFWLNYRIFQTSLPDNSLLTAQALEHKLVQQVSALNYPVQFVTPNYLGSNGCREEILCIWWHILISDLTRTLPGTLWE